mmetsp:Transcript_7366/g.19336  ORF Transcript_7366/g.19336 Transcript_7366/m.19336 type:complete len:223 (+) Transcript_7366:281-949(+)
MQPGDTSPPASIDAFWESLRLCRGRSSHRDAMRAQVGGRSTLHERCARPLGVDGREYAKLRQVARTLSDVLCKAHRRRVQGYDALELVLRTEGHGLGLAGPRGLRPCKKVGHLGKVDVCKVDVRKHSIRLLSRPAVHLSDATHLGQRRGPNAVPPEPQRLLPPQGRGLGARPHLVEARPVFLGGRGCADRQQIDRVPAEPRSREEARAEQQQIEVAFAMALV